MISSHRWGGLPGTAWWRVMDQSGGQLVEQTTHQVDIMRYVAGEVVEVYAKYATRTMGNLENFTIPDAQVAIFEFASGALATMSTSPMAGSGAGKGDISFLLHEQRVDWVGSKLVASPAVPELEEGEPAERPNIDAIFVEAIRANDQSMILSSFGDGLMSLDVTLAANESAATGKPVRTKMA
jgi:predicted dehydrogenase